MSDLKELFDPLDDDETADMIRALAAAQMASHALGMGNSEFVEIVENDSRAADAFQACIDGEKNSLRALALAMMDGEGVPYSFGEDDSVFLPNGETLEGRLSVAWRWWNDD